MFNRRELETLSEQSEQWEAGLLKGTLARHPERQERFMTTSSAPVNRLYTPLDVAELDYERDLGFPGEYPCTRGVHATMHRGRLWTMRMFAGFGTAEETNTRYKYLLDHGETGLSVAFDMPTLYGYDSDDPQAQGEFGRCGVAVSSLADMEVLFDGIPVDEITTSMTINSPAVVIWAMYIVMAEKRGIPMEVLGGTIQNDILKEYIAQKEFIFPPGPSMRLVVDRQGPRRPRNWPLLWLMGSSMCVGVSSGGSISTTLPHAFPSFSTRIMTFSKRCASSGPRAASGPAKCARPLGPQTPGAGSSAFIRRPPAAA